MIEKFKKLQTLIDEEKDVYAFRSIVDYRKLNFYMVTGDIFSVIEITEENMIYTTYNKKEISKIELKENEYTELNIYIGETIYTLDAKNNRTFKRKDLERWLYSFLKELQK